MYMYKYNIINCIKIKLELYKIIYIIYIHTQQILNTSPVIKKI